MSENAKQLKSLLKTRKVIAKKFQKLHSDRVSRDRKLGEKYAPITNSIKKLIDVQKGINDSDDSDDDEVDPLDNENVDFNNNEQNGYENMNDNEHDLEFQNVPFAHNDSDDYELWDDVAIGDEAEIDIDARAESEKSNKNENKDSNSKQRSKIIALKKPKTKIKKLKKQTNLSHLRGFRQEAIDKRKSKQALHNIVDSDSFSDDNVDDYASIGTDIDIDSDAIDEIRNTNKRLKRKSKVDIDAQTVKPVTKAEKKQVELNYLRGYRRHAFNKSKAKQQKQIENIQEQLEKEGRKMQSSSEKSKRTKRKGVKNSRKKVILSPEDFDRYGNFKGLNKPKRRKIASSQKKYKSIRDEDDEADYDDDDDDELTAETEEMVKRKAAGSGLEKEFIPYSENIVYEYWDNPNELCERLKLLIASKHAGNSNHDQEINSIVEELRERNVIY